MRRIVCLLLALIFLLQFSAPAFSEEAGEPQYGVLPALFEGISEAPELLHVMYLNGVVYVDAYDLSDYWGYEVEENPGKWVKLRNDVNPNLPKAVVWFHYDDNKVISTYGRIPKYSYEAPAPSVDNDKGIWIPLEYAVTLLNGELLIQPWENGLSVVRIKPPRFCVGDVLHEIAYQMDRLMFDWTEDFAYTDEMIEVMADASGVVNLINGCLSLDGYAWLPIFQLGDSTQPGMDAKYGDELAILMCTTSQKEAIKAANMWKNISEVLSVKGPIGKILDQVKVSENNRIDALVREFSKHVDDVIANTNTPQADHSHTIAAVRKSMDKLVGLDTDGTKILAKLETMKRTMGAFQLATRGLELMSYTIEYNAQDEFAVNALKHYMNNLPDSTVMPDTMADVMLATTEMFGTGETMYAGSRMLFSVIGEATKNGVLTALGTPVALASFAWDIGSNAIPFLSDKLDASDQFQLSLYATILQNESYLQYLTQNDFIYTEEPDAEKMAQLAKYTYIFLKSCYVTRDAGVASLKGVIKDSEYEAIKAREDKINEDLAEYLVILKSADASNEGYPLGFLPSDNEIYLANHDETNLAKLILVEPYASYMKKIIQLEEDYGTASILTGNVGYQPAMLGGVCFIKLIDFDMDGAEELLVVCKNIDSPSQYKWTMHIFGYDEQDHTITRLFKDETAYGGGVGGDRVSITQHNGQYYVISGHCDGYGIDYDYVGFNNGKFGSVRHIGYDDGDSTNGYQYTYLIDGIAVSDDFFYEQESLWRQNLEEFYLAHEVDELKLRQSKDAKEEILRKCKLMLN